MLNVTFLEDPLWLAEVVVQMGYGTRSIKLEELESQPGLFDACNELTLKLAEQCRNVLLGLPRFPPSDLLRALEQTASGPLLKGLLGGSFSVATERTERRRTRPTGDGNT